MCNVTNNSINIMVSRLSLFYIIHIELNVLTRVSTYTCLCVTFSQHLLDTYHDEFRRWRHWSTGDYLIGAEDIRLDHFECDLFLSNYLGMNHVFHLRCKFNECVWINTCHKYFFYITIFNLRVYKSIIHLYYVMYVYIYIYLYYKFIFSYVSGTFETQQLFNKSKIQLCVCIDLVCD